MLCGLTLPAFAANPVTTWRNDLGRTGQNLQETQLTPANVGTATFGKFYSYPVDGYVFAEPLYVPGLNIAGGIHNVVFVATEHDMVYALDADHNRLLWKVSVIDTAHGAASGATTVPSADVGNSDISPEIGITSTPVIDTVTNAIYVVAKSKESGTHLWRLHALDLATGQEKANSPVVISGSVPGAGSGSVSGVIPFQSLIQSNRESLLLLNGQVYFGYASYGDHGLYHGWLFAYDASTLRRTGIYNSTPGGREGGVWESGAGLAADTVIGSGRIFLATGNGTFDAKAPFTNNQDYGESVIALTVNNGAMEVTDAWTPFDLTTLNSGDLDQGSGGVLVLPDQPGSHIHELIQGGKNGRLELLDRDNLGGHDTTSNSNAVQEISGQNGKLWSTPAYWNGNVYVGGTGVHMKQYRLSNGLLSTSPVASSTPSFSFPGPSPVVSSNGTTNGIMWAIRADAFQSKGPAVLYAFDATNIATQLYGTDQNSARDFAGPAVKFTVPLVVDGKVFVGAQGEVDVYGLLANAPPTAATPVFSPAPGQYAAAQSVTLTDATSGATIYYTTNGSSPTTSSPRYVGPIPVSTSLTIRAIAVAPGLEDSALSRATYTIATTTAAPGFSPAPGAYASAQNVTLSDATSGATIYYTEDGSTPTTGSTRYVGPIPISTSTTIKAIATSTGRSNSAVSIATYTIGSVPPPAASPTFSPAPGTYASAQNVTLTDTTSGAAIYYTRDGSPPTTASTRYVGPIAVSTSTTIKALAAAPGFSNSAVSSGSYTIGTGPVINFGAGFPAATGLTLNGSATAPGDGRLHLTTSQRFQAGSAFWNTQVNIQSFATDFQIQITGPTPLADGMTFTLQAVGPKALGPGGSGLGYGASVPGGTGGILRSAAVKFDLYSNQGEGTDSTGLYLNGASPTIPSVDLSATAVKLTSQHTFAVHIAYNGTTLSVTIKDLVTSATTTRSFTVNLPQTLGSTTAYAGFTGGTGGLVSDQKVLNWTYTH